MTNEYKQTEKEQREKQREIALKNLKSPVLNSLAVSYFANKNNAYGEAGDSAVEQYKYLPALQSKEGSEILTSYLMGSRQDGKRYSGNVSEYNLINNSAKIIQESIASLKFSDVLELMGINKPIKNNYNNKYIADFAESKDKETQEVLAGVIGGYIRYITDKGVSEALGDRTKDIKKSLETILTEPDKKK